MLTNTVTKELEVANSSVKSLMSHQHSLGLIPNSSLIYQFQNKIDNIADNITSTALTGAAIATMGMAAGVIKAGAITAIFSTPLGLGVLGVTGVAALYQFVTRPDQRAHMQLSDVSKKLEKQVCTELSKQFADVESRFESMLNRLNKFTEHQVVEYLIQHHHQILYFENLQQIQTIVKKDTEAQLIKLSNDC